MTEVHESRHDLAFRAEAGDSNAQYSLGVIYLLGETLRQDLALAQQWLEKAAHQQHPEAQVLAERIALAPALQREGSGISANPSVYDVVIRFLGRLAGRHKQTASPAQRETPSRFKMRFKIRF